jgi:methyl-accepting chemotaxis protein
MTSDRYRFLYVSTLTLSILLIASSRVLGVWWFESAVSIAVLFWMLLLGYLVYRKSVSDFDESDADYYYYYGFILTLVTLASTFIPFYFSQSEVSRESIIGGFGLGLVTTFVGLTGRVLLYQQFERLASGTETAVQTIGIVSNKFARELSILTSSMTTNLDELSRSYLDSAASLQRATEMLSSDVVEVSGRMRGLSAVVEETRSGLAVAGEKLKGSFQSEGAACASALSSIAASGATLSTALVQLQQQAQAVDLQRLADQSRDVLDALGGLRGIFDSASETIGGGATELTRNFNSVAESVGVVDRRLAGISKEILDNVERLGSVATSHASFNDSISRSAEAVDKASESILRVSGAMRDSLEDAVRLSRDLSASFQPLATEVHSFRSELVRERETLVRYSSGLSGLTESMSEAGAVINGMARRLDESEKRLDTFGASGIGRVEASIEQLIGTFATVAVELDKLASQLGRASGEVAALQDRQAALWKSQENVQDLVGETHKALLTSLRGLRDEIR